jgi:hypothetical protein
MRDAFFPTLVICLLCAAAMSAAEPPTPVVPAKPGIFGEFTLAGGERVIGIFHPEQGTIEVYGPATVRAVKARDVIATRRLTPEPEAEPATLDAGYARVSTLGALISDAQMVAKRLENQRSELEKARQSVRLEQSKREEGNKAAEEAMVNEQDPVRKAAFAALCTEHLKAIAATHVAIADLAAALAACDERALAAMACCQDLNARMAWLQGRLAPLVREAEAKKAKR